MERRSSGTGWLCSQTGRHCAQSHIARRQMDHVVADQAEGFQEDAELDQVLGAIAGDEPPGLDDHASGGGNRVEDGGALLQAAELATRTAAGFQSPLLVAREEQRDGILVGPVCGPPRSPGRTRQSQQERTGDRYKADELCATAQTPWTTTASPKGQHSGSIARLVETAIVDRPRTAALDGHLQRIRQRSALIRRHDFQFQPVLIAGILLVWPHWEADPP